MELSKYKEAYAANSKQASDITRQLALAGIAIIWIFKLTSDKLNTATHLIPTALILPLIFLVVTLGFDLIQYFLLTVIWWIFFRVNEKKHNGNTTVDIKAPGILPAVGWVFFFAKFATLIIAYWKIMQFLISKL